MSELRMISDNYLARLNADDIMRDMDKRHERAVIMANVHEPSSPISRQWMCVARQVERTRASLRRLKKELNRGIGK